MANEIRTRTPLSPCHHLYTGPESGLVEVGLPHPDDLPKGADYVFEFTPETAPAVGSVFQVLSGGYADSPRQEAWFAFGHGATEHCTGIQSSTYHRWQKGTVYHEPTTYQRIYATPLYLVRLREIRRRLRDQDLDDTAENRNKVRAEMGADWLPSVDR